MLADLRGDESSHFASLIMGHNADGTGYMTTYVPASFGSDVSILEGLTVSKNVECSRVSCSTLYMQSSGSANIVRQAASYTKGQTLDKSLYIGHYLYGSGATNETGNRVAGNEISISNLGNVTYTFSCYEPVAGSTKATSIRLRASEILCLRDNWSP